jgi:predicted RNA binding protein YcfA (HicA-like mRNA interferase family)
MTQIEKLLQAAAASQKNVSFRDFEALLSAFGFVLDRQKGSHQIWKHPDVPTLLNVQPDGKQAKGYQVRQFFAIVDKYGLKPRG